MRTLVGILPIAVPHALRSCNTSLRIIGLVALILLCINLVLAITALATASFAAAQYGNFNTEIAIATICDILAAVLGFLVAAGTLTSFFILSQRPLAPSPVA